MVDKNLKCNLKSNFGTLPESIINLKSSGLPLADSIQIATEFQNKIQQIRNNKRKAVQLKFKKVFKKNTGYYTMCIISKILERTEISRSSLPDYLRFDDIAFMRYDPITSTDVERSFSAYKNLLADNRQSFLYDNIKLQLLSNVEMHVILLTKQIFTKI